jgi:hypothetical protein
MKACQPGTRGPDVRVQTLLLQTIPTRSSSQPVSRGVSAREPKRLASFFSSSSCLRCLLESRAASDPSNPNPGLPVHNSAQPISFHPDAGSTARTVQVKQRQPVIPNRVCFAVLKRTRNRAQLCTGDRRWGPGASKTTAIGYPESGLFRRSHPAPGNTTAVHNSAQSAPFSPLQRPFRS